MELDQGRVRPPLCDYSYQIPGSKQADEFLGKMVDYKLIIYFCFIEGACYFEMSFLNFPEDADQTLKCPSVINVCFRVKR
jgi:hypothetical protein